MVRRMTPETLQGVMGEIQTGFYKVEKLDVLLPKFSIAGDLELLEPLSSLGINSLFGGRSNLTGFMDQYGDPRTASASTPLSTSPSSRSMRREVRPRPPPPSLASALPGLCSTLNSRLIIPSSS